MSALRKCLFKATCKSIIGLSEYRKNHVVELVSLTQSMRKVNITNKDNNVTNKNISKDQCSNNHDSSVNSELIGNSSTKDNINVNNEANQASEMNANRAFSKAEQAKKEECEDYKQINKEEAEEYYSEKSESNTCHNSSASTEEIMEIDISKGSPRRTKPIILRQSTDYSADKVAANSDKEKKMYNSSVEDCNNENIARFDHWATDVNKSVETFHRNAKSENINGCQEREEQPHAISASSYGDGPQRTVGLWSSDELMNGTQTTIEFSKMDEIESEIMEEVQNPEDALIVHNEENEWKHKLMFQYKFKKTPKHLTWKELGQEIECVDCVIEPDTHRPEEMYSITFYFINKQTGTRDVMWSTRNDVAYSEGLTDLLAAVGTCLGRAEVHRTIRFDDGAGVTRDVSIRKASRFTSDILLAFRPAETYDKYTRKEEMNEYEASMEAAGMSMWGFHPELMNAEYNELDFNDPPGTYTIKISAHSFSFILLRAIKRLLQRPLRDFYRPSQVARVATITNREEIGIGYAIQGWLGIDKPFYPHLTSIDAVQDHWLGRDAPFTLCAIINKLREMTYLQRENPEFQSWLSLRYQSTRVALRNIHVKLLGVGASTLFLPTQHSTTVNRLLPRAQQRKLSANFSVNAMLGLPDETRRLGEFRQLTSHPYLADSSKNEKENKDKNNDSTNMSGDSKTNNINRSEEAVTLKKKNDNKV